MKIIPGVRLNLGTRGVSVSVGGRGVRTTVGRQGVRTTVGLPGTGLSYTHLDKWGAPRGAAPAPSGPAPHRIPPRPATLGESLALVAGIAFLAVLAGVHWHWLFAAAGVPFAVLLGWAVWLEWRSRTAPSAAPVVAPVPAPTLAPLARATGPAVAAAVAPAPSLPGGRGAVAAAPSSVAPVRAAAEAAARATCARALRYAHLCQSPDAVRALLTSGADAPVSELSAALGMRDHMAVVTLLDRAAAKRNSTTGE